MVSIVECPPNLLAVGNVSQSKMLLVPWLKFRSSNRQLVMTVTFKVIEDPGVSLLSAARNNSTDTGNALHQQ